MNPLWSNSFTTYTEGATNVDTTGSGWMSMVSNFAVKKGKWYWEFKTDSGNAFVGMLMQRSQIYQEVQQDIFSVTMMMAVQTH